MKSVSKSLAASVTCLLLVSGCQRGGRPAASRPARPAADEILIGEFGSFTGSTATFGLSCHRGIMLAVEQLNAAGGVLGRKLRVISEDDASKPEEANSAALKLINQDRVLALLGEVASSRSLAAAPVAQGAGVPMLTPASTNPKVTQVGDHIFRACFTDDFQGLVCARFAAEHLKAKRVAILRDIKNDYSVGLADSFTRHLQARGGEIVADEGYSEGDKDFRAQLTTIRYQRPDALFIPGYYTEVGLVAKQARSLGLSVPLLGGDGWDAPQLVEIGGEAVEGCYFSNHYSVEDPSPRVQQFVGAFRARYHGETPDAMAALGYDAARMLADAIRRAGELDHAALRAALAATKGFAGVTGTVTLDQQRNPVKSAVILQIRHGRQTLVQVMEPQA